MAARPVIRRPARTRQPARAALAALALLLGTLGVAAAPAPAVQAAAPATVNVTLTIDAVDIINCLDEFIELGCGNADFYPVVTVNGGAEEVRSKIDDDNHITPNWQFETGTIPYVAGDTVIFTVDIYDSDGTFRGDDDHADIAPPVGRRQLVITVGVGDVPCVIDQSGDIFGDCGVPIVSSGTEGEEAARITYRVNVLNDASDIDGDGLADDWETGGVTFNGQVIDLPAMGADPNKPDVFIHLDWMQDATHDQQLAMTAIQLVVNAFANSGYRSPTGSTGINLHVDQGSNSTLDFTANTTWGTLSRAQPIPWQNNIGTSANEQYDWTEFQAFKDANFNPTGRGPIFHYAIAAFFLEPPAAGKSQSTSTGISRNSPGDGFAEGTSDFLITLGTFGTAASDVQEAGTLMHELGHNLGLRHGGFENRHFKPNYPSIMNYFFQLGGLAVTDSAGATTLGTVDYSHGTLAAISEESLDEAVGLGAAFNRFGIGTRCPVAGSDPKLWTSSWSDNGDVPFDWNCDGDATDGVVEWDANGSDAVDNDEFEDFDDWSALLFRVGAIGDLGNGDLDLPLESPIEEPVTTDNLAPTTTATLAGTLGMNGWYRSAVTVTLSAVDAGDAGVALTEYRIGGGAWSTYTAPFVVTGDSPGIVVEFRSHDHVGNEEAVKSVTIKIDTGGPTVTCSVAPNRLWPPNHKLAPVAATVSVSDAGSGPAGFVLTSVVSNQPDNGLGDGDTPNDVQGFAAGTPDVAGQLRAERAGSAVRVYTLRYLGRDLAGNTTSCATTVSVRN